MDGYNKAKDAADKLRVEKDEQEESKLQVKEEVKSQLQTVQENTELAKMYADNSQVGASNLSAGISTLRVYAAGKSKVIMENGKAPTDGWFYYSKTDEQFEAVTCHILTISKGFRAESMPDKDGKTRMVWNQIMGGVIIDGSEYKPFIMYFTGKKLNNLWDFGKTASRYTKAKPVGIPMFALQVDLSAKREDNSYSYSWLVEFEIRKQDDGAPVLVLDPGKFQFLRDTAEILEETIAASIESKMVKMQDLPDEETIDGSHEDIPFS